MKKINSIFSLSLIALAVAGFTSSVSANTIQEQSDTLPAQSNSLPPLGECAKYDNLSSRANADFIPLSNCDSLTPDLFGLRSMLGEHGIGIQLQASQTMTYDLLQNNSGEQTYNGQDATNISMGMAIFTYDLSRIGFNDDAQLTVQFNFQDSDYTNVAPRTKNVDVLAINQRFFDQQLEVQYGFFPIFRSFYGLSLGTNTTSSAQGASSFVPVEVGMSSDQPTPTFSFAIKDPTLRYYNRFAVSRAGSLQYDNTENHTGLKWDVTGTRAFFADEVGYRRMAGPDTKSLWVRAGAMYNASDVQYLNDATQTSANYGTYIAATAQLTQPYNDMRGLAVDVKGNLAKSEVNQIDRDIGASIFYIGPFQSRPMDMVALGYDKSFYSKDAQGATLPDGVSYTSTTSLSYAAHITNGIYAITGLSYITDPSVTKNSSDALNFSATINVTF